MLQVACCLIAAYAVSCFAFCFSSIYRHADEFRCSIDAIAPLPLWLTTLFAMLVSASSPIWLPMRWFGGMDNDR